MADKSGDNSLRVTAEERLHPAYQKLARAIIALARLRSQETSADRSASDQPAPSDSEEVGDD